MQKQRDFGNILEGWWYSQESIATFIGPNPRNINPNTFAKIYSVCFRENELVKNGYWRIVEELVYQWLGLDATPYWWSDAILNTGLDRYVIRHIVLGVSYVTFFLK